jgi:hypothetical protein
MATLAEAQATYRQMVAAGIGDTSKKACVRRIDNASAVAVYKEKVYVLTDTSGSLDYDDLNRSTVRATELVGFA